MVILIWTIFGFLLKDVDIFPYFHWIFEHKLSINMLHLCHVRNNSTRIFRWGILISLALLVRLGVGLFLDEYQKNWQNHIHRLSLFLVEEPFQEHWGSWAQLEAQCKQQLILSFSFVMVYNPLFCFFFQLSYNIILVNQTVKLFVNKNYFLFMWLKNTSRFVRESNNYFGYGLKEIKYLSLIFINVQLYYKLKS